MNTFRAAAGPWVMAVFLMALASPAWPGRAAVVQSFDRLFQGDDPTESFTYTLALNPAVDSTVRFSGFVENLSLFDETGALFLFGWGQTNNLEQMVRFPADSPTNMGVRFPAADPVQGRVRVPLEFEARMGFAPALLRFGVEGLGCCDNFRLVGDLTVEPTAGPPLHIGFLKNATVRLRWTTSTPNYVLEYATSLSAVTWLPVTNGVVVSGSNFSVTVPMEAGLRLFRLRQ